MTDIEKFSESNVTLHPIGATRNFSTAATLSRIKLYCYV